MIVELGNLLNATTQVLDLLHKIWSIFFFFCMFLHGIFEFEFGGFRVGGVVVMLGEH